MSRGIDTKRGTYSKANWALGLSALGLITAYPFQNVFWGGLLTSGCSAALVGGLADWFAVNALFRRPLGVRPGRIFRTEIIPRNRERIYSALSDMVQNELLSQEALKNKLAAYDFSEPLLKIWEAEGSKRFDDPLTQLLQGFMPSLASGVAGLEKEWEQILGDEKLQQENVVPWMGQVLSKILDSTEGKKAVETVLKNLSVWVQSPEVHRWLVHWIENAIARYINENTSRRFLTMFLPDPSVLGTKIQDQIVDTLHEDSAVEGIISWAKKASTEFQTVPENLILKAQQTLSDTLSQKLEDSESASRISRLLLEQAEVWVGKLKERPEERLEFNAQVQTLLLPVIENQHQRIGKIVQEGLERYSDEMLVELIESKAGEDLQMIRINGSVVGGMVGMLIFILSYIV